MFYRLLTFDYQEFVFHLVPHVFYPPNLFLSTEATEVPEAAEEGRNWTIVGVTATGAFNSTEGVPETFFILFGRESFFCCSRSSSVSPEKQHLSF